MLIKLRFYVHDVCRQCFCCSLVFLFIWFPLIDDVFPLLFVYYPNLFFFVKQIMIIDIYRTAACYCFLFGPIQNFYIELLINMIDIFFGILKKNVYKVIEIYIPQIHLKTEPLCLNSRLYWHHCCMISKEIL